MKAGIISDTHGLLRQEVSELLRGCDIILHGGDINRREILEELGKIAPVYAVRGNNDGEWAQDLPETRTFVFGGLRIFMIHNRKKIRGSVPDCDIVLFGHTHKYEEIRDHGIDTALAGQICRLYLTHPGVDADGILNKMGL